MTIVTAQAKSKLLALTAMLFINELGRVFY